jgi:hypothetical protein
MRHALATSLFCATCAWAFPLAAEPPVEVHTSSAPNPYPCGDPGCGLPSVVKMPTYSAEIPRNGDFTAELSIAQPCSCMRPLSAVVAFTPKGSTSTRERVFKLSVAPGNSTSKLALSNAELAKLKVPPGHYTVAFALLDEHEQRANTSGLGLAGQPFTFGTSKEELASKPVVPAAISRDGDLAVPFVFKNAGDIATSVTALLAFTRPDATDSIEYYKKDLTVRPGGATHVVHLSAAQRRELKIGPGAWLVTAAAFEVEGARLASYPGNLLMIGQVLSIPGAPDVTSPIDQSQDLGVTLTIKNDNDIEDLVTAVLIFSRPDVHKPIEHKVEGIHVSPGSSAHTILLSPLDRYNIGVRPGRWRVSATALDRAGRRLELRRGNELVLSDSGSEAAPKKP